MHININAGRNKYFEKIQTYRDTIQTLLKREEIAKKSIHIKGPESAKIRLRLAEDMLTVSSNYIVLNGVSLSMLKLSNEEALNESRKTFTRAIVYLEELVSPFLDVPYSDYEDKLAEISFLSAKKRYDIIKKTGLVLNLLKETVGENIKWKWAFVDLEGRYATVAKNIMNLKTAVANTDPRAEDYEPTVYHIRLIKKLLNQAADRYRERYELYTNIPEDFNMGIKFLNALKRIHIILGERSDAESVKKKSDTWAGKLETDQKQKK